MNKIIIRECILQDYNSISILNKIEMGYDYSPKETYKGLKFLLSKKDNKIYVAVLEDQVVGYIHASDYNVLYAPHMKNILGIAVNSNFKKQGIGKMLLSAVEQWAKDTNAFCVRLASGAVRKDAHEFYRHCGYGNEKEQINFKKILIN